MEKIKKLSTAHCKKILESEGQKYSDEETEMIRDLLYKLGELDYIICTETTLTLGQQTDYNKAA
jgi:hypothetical protein